MLGRLFRKNARKELRRAYEAAMREARDVQRRGDIQAYAAKAAEADRIRQQLEDLEAGGLDSRSAGR